MTRLDKIAAVFCVLMGCFMLALLVLAYQHDVKLQERRERCADAGGKLVDTGTRRVCVRLDIIKVPE